MLETIFVFYRRQNPILLMLPLLLDEAFLYKYKGKDYFFDSYDCKQAFKMNPDKFINNMCHSIGATVKWNLTALDLAKSTQIVNAV